ncbi:MAG: hypothetical protein ABSA41_04170 [Terriglobia bacterium]
MRKKRIGTISVERRCRRAKVLTLAARALMAAALASLLFVLGGSLEGRSAAGSDATQAAAQALEAKLRTLHTVDARPAKSYPPIVITENEANSYLTVHGGEFLPAGVHGPGVRILPEHVMGFADVDFGEFSRIYSNPQDWGPKVLAAMFKGTQRVTATGKLQSSNGQAKLQIESVTVGSMTVPSWLVDFVIENYLQPRYKFDLSKPIPLPDHVTQIVLGSGQAIFLRSPNKTP